MCHWTKHQYIYIEVEIPTQLQSVLAGLFICSLCFTQNKHETTETTALQKCLQVNLIFIIAYNVWSKPGLKLFFGPTSHIIIPIFMTRLLI